MGESNEPSMTHVTIEQLGSPSVRLVAFQLWVHGRQFPDARDEWDGNWLNVTAHCGRAGASIWATGAILDTVGLARFRQELARLHQRQASQAVLESDEPNVAVRVTAADTSGHVRVRVDITPDHLSQGHWLEFEADQSYLPKTIAQLDSLLMKFPVRGLDG